MTSATSKITNITLVGVGGQGILLTSEVIARAAMLNGMDVKKNEVHGMAQRGGSVVSEVRVGKKVYSPLIPMGETDFLVSFELLEALRYADDLAPGGHAFICSQVITPVTVSSGQQEGVDDLEDRVNRVFPNHTIIDAVKIAEDLGNIRAANMVMTGALSRLVDVSEDIWLQAVTELVPPKYKDVNLSAFAAGRAAL